MAARTQKTTNYSNLSKDHAVYGGAGGAGEGGGGAHMVSGLDEAKYYELPDAIVAVPNPKEVGEDIRKLVAPGGVGLTTRYGLDETLDHACPRVPQPPVRPPAAATKSSISLLCG
eukprot:m.114231 g.114231  ORF g.114231 m.114231 type:complete len:115 (+) comp21505_c0_seq10:3350-3694(+)